MVAARDVPGAQLAVISLAVACVAVWIGYFRGDSTVESVGWIASGVAWLSAWAMLFLKRRNRPLYGPFFVALIMGLIGAVLAGGVLAVVAAVVWLIRGILLGQGWDGLLGVAHFVGASAWTAYVLLLLDAVYRPVRWK